MQNKLKKDSKNDKRYVRIEFFQQESFESISIVKDSFQYSEPYYLKKDLKGEELKNFQKRLEYFSKLQHPQLDTIKDFYFDSNQQQLSIILNNFKGTSYQELLENNSFLSEYEAVQLMNQALKMLSYVHKKGFFHGNICPQNLLKAEDESLILVNFKLIQDIRATAQNEFLKTSKKKNYSSYTNLEDNIGPIEEVELSQYQDIRDLAITILMLIGLKPEELPRKNNNTWKWCSKKQISDARTILFEQILSSNLNSSGISAESVYQSLNTVLPISTSSNLSSLSAIVVGLLGILLILTGLATFSIKDENSSNISQGNEFVERQEFREESLEDIPKTSILTPETALEIIRSWLEIKGEVFGRARNDQLLSHYTTGAYYEKAIGTIGWLRKNRAYYTYENPTVRFTGHFELSDKQATIGVQIYERPTLYFWDGGIDESASTSEARTYRFTLEFSNDKWKIANAIRID